MVTLLRSLWHRVHEPRVIAVAMCVGYVALAVGGASALLNPPTSIEGQIGATAMATLAGLLTFGGVIGAVAVLPGRYWLERNAVLAIGVAVSIYALIVATLQVTSTSGNRILQLSILLFAAAGLVVRWQRIKDRPYDPDRPPPTRTADAA